MIANALNLLTSELNTYFTRIYQPLEARAVLAPLLAADGTAAAEVRNKVSVTLLNVEPEHLLRNPPQQRLANTSLSQRTALNLNLLVLFAANFDDYGEALKFLQGTLAYFQQRSSPKDEAPRLVAELETTTYQQWSYVWGMLGTRHMPAAIYRIRLVPIQQHEPEEVQLITHAVVTMLTPE